MPRDRWEANADPRSGFDAHDPDLRHYPDTHTPWLADLIERTARQAREEQARVYGAAS